MAIPKEVSFQTIGLLGKTTSAAVFLLKYTILVSTSFFPFACGIFASLQLKNGTRYIKQNKFLHLSSLFFSFYKSELELVFTTVDPAFTKSFATEITRKP